jgi:hypothetical protein
MSPLQWSKLQGIIVQVTQVEKRPRADALGHISICLPQNPRNLFANNAKEQLNWSFQCNIHQGPILKGSGIWQEQYISPPDKYIYIYKVSHWMWDIGDKPEHDPLNNNNYIYIFRNIKTPNYVLFLLCVCLIYQSWMFVLLMMPHVGPVIRQ